MQRDFKGIWIPKELWMMKDINLMEKVMLIEIDSLDNENGCYATNDYFADFFRLSKGRISKIINNLVRRGYITSEIKYKEGTQIVEKRTLRISHWSKQKNNHPYSQKQPEGMVKCDYTYSQKRPRPMVENDQYSKLENKLNNTMSQILDEPKISNAGVKKQKNFDSNSEPYLLANFLEKKIAANNPKFPRSEQQRQRWAKDFDLMIRRDKLDPDDIAAVIEWCQSDSFWRCNILSGKKLREKYQQLSMKMVSDRR